MRHAVLGVGGVGGLLAGALARSGADVVLLLRPETLARYTGRLAIESAVLGDFEVDVPAASSLDAAVDVLWVTTKATQLESALSSAPEERVRGATVVPLLNGVDHVGVLRARYGNVVAGTIRVESERVSPTLFRQTSPFLRVDLAGAADAQEALRRAGVECVGRSDETSLLWEKLAFLAPVALTTSALDAPLGTAREDPRFVECTDEALSVARREGALLDGDAIRALQAAAPHAMRSSMQKDVEAGREPELDAIAGPIVRGGVRHGIPARSTADLASLVRVRHRSRAARDV
jgi:2-dehydropantoate 2-reductase